MMTKAEFLEYVLNRMDPDEIVDEFGLSSEDLVRCTPDLLYARRYRIAYKFDDEDILEQLDYIDDDEYDEEAYYLRVMEELDDEDTYDT